MDIKNEKSISCEDVAVILRALKGGELNREDLELLENSVLRKISLHIAECEACLSVAEALKLSVGNKAE